MLFRQAFGADIDTLVQSNLALALESEALGLDREVVRAGIQALFDNQALGQYYVLEDQDQIVAQLMITYEWSDWRNRQVWWIQSVYVPPVWRGRGYFKALYQETKALARAQGACGLRLNVDIRNTKAQKVYECVGMDGDHYRVYEDMF